MPFTACHTHHQPHPPHNQPENQPTKRRTRQAMHTKTDAQQQRRHDTPQRNQHTPHNQRGIPTNKTTKQDNPSLRKRKSCLDARVHYPDLKQQPHTTPTPTDGGPAWPGRLKCQLAADSSEPQQRVCQPTVPTPWTGLPGRVGADTPCSHSGGGAGFVLPRL